MDYKNRKNEYELNGDLALITILKKNNTPLVTKIDVEDLEKVLEAGTWHAAWHKDFNSYLVQRTKITMVNGKRKHSKETLNSFLMAGDTRKPIRHINEDTLDNRKKNLEVFHHNKKNEYDIVDENTIAIILRNKFGKNEEKALISKSDLDKVITDDYTWVYNKNGNRSTVLAHTPEGKVLLDRMLMKTPDNMFVYHINLNPLDNRRSNLENKKAPK